MRVILVRHYQTVSNSKGKILGHSDSPPCPESAKDIDFIQQQLDKNDVKIDAIYSSALARARRTAEMYAANWGLSEISHAMALNELNYGALQTRDKSWVKCNFPEYKVDPAFVFPDGESFQQMQQRSVEYLSSLVTSHAGQTALVVVHAGVIRGFISHFLGLNYALSLQQRIPFRYIGDFQFEDKKCITYNELGEISGFIIKPISELPINF